MSVNERLFQKMMAVVNDAVKNKKTIIYPEWLKRRLRETLEVHGEGG